MSILIGLIIVFGIPIVGFLVVYFYLAPRNLFFTFVTEGTCKIILKGRSFHKILIQYKGHTLDKDFNVIEGEERHLLGGLRYYGIWPLCDVAIYPFGWTNMTIEGKIEKHPKKIIDYVLLKDDVYWAEIENAEDINLLPLFIGVTYTIRICNPYKAKFNVQNWLETVLNQTIPVIRDIITKDSYENWIKQMNDIGNIIFKEAENIISDIREKYGVEISRIQIRNIDPPKEIRDKTLASYLAEQKKRAKIIEAEAEEERIKKVYNAIREIPDGISIRTLEALEKSPEKGNKVIIPIPGVLDKIGNKFLEKK
ncbi:MAG: SPFH domain-containing protein [Candidatus Pacebacteria bacterium]|nr:SPFH domain-containing protein [Candidatus Paceibacterota bacterium]HOK35572.1 SPFH domain-containing protein [Candidatus Pacearchaeota archaeon]HOL90210.1 SPFH domain-containing protein [Candidatus Pacearchaeota archaeon]HPQ22967.1 SPFH domain-containing protein [Candidatus Paceibacterota bacterium]